MLAFPSVIAYNYQYMLDPKARRVSIFLECCVDILLRATCSPSSCSKTSTCSTPTSLFYACTGTLCNGPYLFAVPLYCNKQLLNLPCGREFCLHRLPCQLVLQRPAQIQHVRTLRRCRKWCLVSWRRNVSSCSMRHTTSTTSASRCAAGPDLPILGLRFDRVQLWGDCTSPRIYEDTRTDLRRDHVYHVIFNTPELHSKCDQVNENTQFYDCRAGNRDRR